MRFEPIHRRTMADGSKQNEAIEFENCDWNEYNNLNIAMQKDYVIANDYFEKHNCMKDPENKIMQGLG